MKKLILKTAAITLAAIILAGGLLFGGLWLFSPVTLAKISEDLGNESAAASFYARQYDKSGDYKDLHKLCAVLDEHSNSAKAEKYLGEFIENENFVTYIFSYDVREKEGEHAAAFYAKKYVVSAFINGGAAHATEVASRLASGKYFGNDAWGWVYSGVIMPPYSFYDAFNALLSDGKLNLTRGDLEVVKASISATEINEYDEEYKNADLKRVNELINSIAD